MNAPFAVLGVWVHNHVTHGVFRVVRTAPYYTQCGLTLSQRCHRLVRPTGTVTCLACAQYQALPLPQGVL